MSWEKQRFVDGDVSVRLWRYRGMDVVIDAHGPGFDLDAAGELALSRVLVRRSHVCLRTGGERDREVLERVAALLASHGLTLLLAD
ncbi:MAG TPA: hypothetical protein VFN49_00915 [Candidatus Aquilonibacter sp.]|nr:hypothetical protein [Candidatus Aquilonibacter sp.]